MDHGLKTLAPGRSTNDVQTGLHRTLLLQALRLEDQDRGPRPRLFLHRDNRGACKPPRLGNLAEWVKESSLKPIGILCWKPEGSSTTPSVGLPWGTVERAKEDWFGRRLKEVREGSGLTQAQLAEFAGVSEQAVKNWESGRKFPAFERIPRLARLLGVPPGRFFPEEDGATADRVEEGMPAEAALEARLARIEHQLKLILGELCTRNEGHHPAKGSARGRGRTGAAADRSSRA